ncbi:MAG: fructose-6-phosphate aldolase [Armatimonadetes bacterium]|nr:fructose-6-phosphate aldolase [Armatimonadota bacterium]
MKLFIDTAIFDEIKEVHSWGILAGVTTNPSLMAASGRSFKEVIRDICALVNGPVSAEAVTLNADEMIKEARELASWAPNVIVKFPITADGLKATSVVSKEGIKVNMTLIFSANQALLAARAGASFVSPFVGRVDDINGEGMSMVREISEVFQIHRIQTEVIAASIRHPLHVTQAALAGADIATIPYKVFKQMLHHPLTDTGITRFLEDWKKVPQVAKVRA